MDQVQTTKVIHHVIKAGRDYLNSKNYTEVVVPRVVRASGSCENINTLFEVSSDKDMEWFGNNAYLAQTGQLYLEALVPELNKVYCVGPSFRAEPKVDNRHLTEFLMTEIELAGDFDNLLKEIEGYIYAIAQSVIHKNELYNFGFSGQTIERLKLCPTVFPKIRYDQAIEKLKELGEDIQWGDDISSKREKMLLNQFENQPLLITHYPDPMYDFGKEIEVEKFFNMLPDNKGRVLSADCILPFGGESVGAAARVHIKGEMVARLKNSRMFQLLKEIGGDIEDFKWYIDNLEKNGSVPHAGCGFGMARIAQWILGTPSIVQAVTFASNKATII